MMAANNEGGNYPKTGGERRKRTVFSPSQLEILKAAFEENRYPGYETREALAKRVGVEENRVHVWFQNRRARTLKRKGSGNRMANLATAACNITEITSPRSSLGSSQNIPQQPYYAPQNFQYPESYGGGGGGGEFWQPPRQDAQCPVTSSPPDLYTPHQQSSLGWSPVHSQQAALGGTGPCGSPLSNNFPAPYYGAEMERQNPPSAATLSADWSNYTSWSGVENYAAASGSEFFSFPNY